jgi:amino acid permease
MILVSIVYAFTETLVIFFFVGTGVSVRDYTNDNNLDTKYHKKSIGIKRVVYPPLLMNMLYMIILFVIVGAVDTMRVAPWIYYLLFVFCIFDYVRIKIIQNTCFRENTENILAMSGIEPKAIAK